MTADADIKRQVREFYDQVGWMEVGEGVYQNAHYEDLRPVARDYIHRCHLRVKRFLKPSGQYLLDAGSGPIQYPEYLEYSQGYQYRVCADISILALKEARKRIGDRGLFVVADIANLPFKPDIFEAVVSLHTIHHLPETEHLNAYSELHRTLAQDSSAVVVNGWPVSPLMNLFDPLIRFSNRVRGFLKRRLGQKESRKTRVGNSQETLSEFSPGDAQKPKGTFTNRHGVAWVKTEVGGRMPVEIRVWRSVSVRFLRALIHPGLGGRGWLRLLFWLEELFPHFFGEKGQYPLIIIRNKA